MRVSGQKSLCLETVKMLADRERLSLLPVIHKRGAKCTACSAVDYKWTSSNTSTLTTHVWRADETQRKQRLLHWAFIQIRWQKRSFTITLSLQSSVYLALKHQLSPFTDCIWRHQTTRKRLGVASGNPVLNFCVRTCKLRGGTKCWGRLNSGSEGMSECWSVSTVKF